MTPKLEELYLLLNEVAEDNATFFKFAYGCAEGNEAACLKLREYDELELFGYRRAKQIIMYIRLYFPKLSRMHQLLYSAQREFNNLIWNLLNAEALENQELVNEGLKVSHYLRLIENEIIQNRDALLGDYVFWQGYRKTTDEELGAIPEPPDGPILSSPNHS